MRLPRTPAVSALMAVVLLLGLAGPARSDEAGGDPLRAQQWHLDAVSATEAWEHSRGDGITVAVVDTGVDADHPDLAERVLAGYNATAPGTPADDDNGHGTLVAGVVAAVAGNGEGGVGVAPHASILPVRVLDGAGRGEPDQVADGIRWAAERGADVINLSFVEVPGAANELLDGLGLIDRQVEQAIRDAHAAGSVVIAAAGNEGVDDVPYADDLPVTVVGASDRAGRRWHRSNADADTLFAPGVDIASTWSAERYAEASGTSFAAPIVAAGAAMLLDLGVAADDVGDLLAAEAAAPQQDGAVSVIDLRAVAESARPGTIGGASAPVADASARAVGSSASGDRGDRAGPGDHGDADEVSEVNADTGQDGDDTDPAGTERAPVPAVDDEVAVRDRLSVATRGGPPLVLTVLAWALLSTVAGAHVAVRRAGLLE